MEIKKSIPILFCTLFFNAAPTENTTKYPVPKPEFSPTPVTFTPKQWAKLQKAQKEKEKEKQILVAYKTFGIDREPDLNRRYKKLGENRDSLFLELREPSIIDKTQRGDLSALSELENQLLNRIVERSAKEEQNLVRQLDSRQISNAEFQSKSRDLLVGYREVTDDIKYVLGRVTDYYSDPENLE